MSHDVLIGGEVFRVRRPIAVMALTIGTLFVYWVVWYYKINDEARRYLADEEIKPWRSVLALTPGLLIVFPPFISIARTGSRIKRMEHQAQLTKTVSPTKGCALAILTGITLLFAGSTCYYYQSHLNAVWSSATIDRAEDT